MILRVPPQSSGLAPPSPAGLASPVRGPVFFGDSASAGVAAEGDARWLFQGVVTGVLVSVFTQLVMAWIMGHRQPGQGQV